MTQLKRGTVVYLPDTRGVEISRYGFGNLKIGSGVFTYSRPAGRRDGTCPGSTPECEAICYAKHITGPVHDVYERNVRDDVPPIPDGCLLLRIHVSGDFDSNDYIESWIARLKERPEVTAWAYTRSWRVPQLLAKLEGLRALPNMQLFASMDQSHTDVPPAGWRRAWIDGDVRAGEPTGIAAHNYGDPGFDSLIEAVRAQHRTFDGTATYICPEETGHKANCLECGYCFEGQSRDVTFLRH